MAQTYPPSWRALGGLTWTRGEGAGGSTASSDCVEPPQGLETLNPRSVALAMKFSSAHSPRCLAFLMMMQRRRWGGRVWLVTSLLALFLLAVLALSVFVLADFLLPVCLLPMESAQKHQRRKPGGCAFGSLQNF